MKILYSVILLVTLFSCKKNNIENPIISIDLEKTLDTYIDEHEQKEVVKMIQVTFSKWDNNCYITIEAYPKTIDDDDLFKFKGKTIVVVDENDCTKNFVKSSYIRKQSVLKIVRKQEKIDTSKSFYPMSVDFYNFDENNKIQYSPKL